MKAGATARTASSLDRPIEAQALTSDAWVPCVADGRDSPVSGMQAALTSRPPWIHCFTALESAWVIQLSQTGWFHSTSTSKGLP